MVLYSLATSYSSSDSDEQPLSPLRLFAFKRSVHEILGGGKVADILLWENKSLTGAILIGVTIIWFLLEVVEYNFITLLCHVSIFMMLIMFIWSTGAGFVGWHVLFPKITAISSLLWLSIIGSSFSSLNLLYIGFLSLATLPALYDRNQKKVDDLARQGKRHVRKLYKKFDSKILNKIRRGPVKEKEGF